MFRGSCGFLPYGIHRLVVLSLVVVLVVAALFGLCLVVVVFLIFCRLVFHFYFTRNNDKTVSGQTHIDFLHVTIDIHLQI